MIEAKALSLELRSVLKNIPKFDSPDLKYVYTCHAASFKDVKRHDSTSAINVNC